MSSSRLDKIYRSILFSKYFIKGWGSPENLKKLLEFHKIISCREECYSLVAEDYPLVITKDRYHGGARIIEGYFHSPFDVYLPKIVPEESKVAKFQVLLPRKWNSNVHRPVCMHFAGTGDHYFWRRRHLIAKPLLKEAGIGSILLENPFYGARKPVDQLRSALHNVSDIFVMGGCLILEGLVLLKWCKKQGFGPLGISGLSMGGYMACLVASNWPYPLILVPCLCSQTASGVFTEGVMSRAINWELLQCQYNENCAFKTEIEKLVKIKYSNAFKAGKELVRRFPDSMTYVNDDAVKKSIGREEPLPTNLQKTNTTIRMKNLRVTLSEWAKQRISTHVIHQMQQKLVTYSSKHRLVKLLKKKQYRRQEKLSETTDAVNFMRGIMDEFTHLENFSVPVDTSLIISICARDDGYIPCQEEKGLADIWPGAEVRFIDAGHISAFLLHQREFRLVIIEAFQRYIMKYCSD